MNSYTLIVDNIIFDLQKIGGISVYWYELIKRMSDIDVVFFDSMKDNNILKKQMDFTNYKVLQTNNKGYRRYINLKNEFTKNMVIFHSSYYRTMKGKNVLNITTIHDFTYEKYFKGLKKYLHIIQKKHAIKKSEGLICISENTKNDLIKLYPWARKKMIKIINNGYDDKSYYYNERPLKDQVIFVGARTEYKNFSLAVDLVSSIEGLKLIIIGSKITNIEYEMLEKKLKDRYMAYTNVSNEVLKAHYQESICLLYLSKYEGFGIPLIEAMACGCPVIAFRNSSIPEVMGKAGLLFDEYDNIQMRYFINKLASDFNYRRDVINLGLLNVRRFSWDKAYKETLEFYNEVYSHKGKR